MFAAEVSAVRAQASAMAVDNGAPPDADSDMMFYDGDTSWVDMGGEDDDDDEGEMLISHGGGEREDRTQAIFETITMPSCVLLHSYSQCSHLMGL